MSSADLTPSNGDADPLNDPLDVGALSLPHRVCMAPMTRCRSTMPGNVPNELMATYYRQRASAGLIFTEATQVTPRGIGYVATPGIHSDAQLEGWRLVTDAVHDAGGRIVAQLWHVGRVSHPDFQPDGDLPVAPSAVRPEGLHVHLPDGKKEVPEPRALDAEELPGVVAEFRRGAEVAQAAGFDGVELHAANGYLIDQFLRTRTNRRTDAFGGSPANRCRFPLMVVDALLEVWDADRVGVRVSPTGGFNDMDDDDPLTTFTHFAEKLAERDLAFLEVVGQLFDQPEPDPRLEAIEASLRTIFPGPSRGKGVYLANGDYTADRARAALADGKADAITFGRPFLANPDLPRRIAEDAEFNDPRPALFYDPGAGANGYTDYPTLQTA